MIYEFRLPDLGSNEVEFLGWQVREGDHVEEGRVLCKVLLSKKEIDVPSPKAGIILKQVARVGDRVRLSQLVAILRPAAAKPARPKRIPPEAPGTETVLPKEEEKPAAADPDATVVMPPPAKTEKPPIAESTLSTRPSTPAEKGSSLAMPAIRRLASELGVDLASVTGTGPQGRILEEDVRKAHSPTGPAPAKQPASKAEPVRADPEKTLPPAPVGAKDITGAKPEEKTLPPAPLGTKGLPSALPGASPEAGGPPPMQPSPAKAGEGMSTALLEIPVFQARPGSTKEEKPAPPAKKEEQPVPFGAAADDEVKVSFTAARRRDAQETAASWKEIPHAFHLCDADATSLRSYLRELHAEGHKRGVEVSDLVFIARALLKTLPEFPDFNSRIHEDGGGLTRKRSCHLGVTVAPPGGGGLLYPVLKDAHRKDFWTLAAELARLPERAREHAIRDEECREATFTATYLAQSGSLSTLPLIRRPQVAALGVTRAQERSVVIGGGIHSRWRMRLALSYDRRAADPALAGAFLSAVARRIEAPRSLT